MNTTMKLPGVGRTSEDLYKLMIPSLFIFYVLIKLMIPSLFMLIKSHLIGCPLTV